jgi:hypothetical protein
MYPDQLPCSKNPPSRIIGLVLWNETDDERPGPHGSREAGATAVEDIHVL